MMCITSDPIEFIRNLVKNYKPKLAVPETGTGNDYQMWVYQVQQKLREVLKLESMVSAPCSISDVKTRIENGIRREWFYLQTEPDYWVPVLVNIPNGKEPYPLILCLHGHTPNGKEGVSGLIGDISGDDTEELRRLLEFFNDTYAVDLAHRGYLTVCLDNRSFNNARHIKPYTYNESPYNWHIAEIVWQNALGRNYIGSLVWDALKVFDYTIQRSDVDSYRTGCIGFSLGGMLSLYVALLDSRIKSVVISGYFDSLLQKITKGHGADCLCNYIPDLFSWFDIPDLTAALAPRPVLCNNEISRPEHREQKKKYFACVEKVYEAMNASENCELFTWVASHHVFSGQRAYPWFEDHLPTSKSP